MLILVILSYHKKSMLAIVDSILYGVGVGLLWSFYQDYKVRKLYQKALKEKERYLKQVNEGGLHG